MSAAPGSTRLQKPTTLKVQKGSLNTSRQNKLEPKGHPGIPKAPPYLLASEKEAWERFAEVLYTSLKVLTKEDFASFEGLVCCYDEWRRLRQAMREVKEIVTAEPKFNKAGEKTGEVIKLRPEWVILNQVDTRLAQWIGRFGLSPGDRARVQTWDDSITTGGAAQQQEERAKDTEFGQS